MGGVGSGNRCNSKPTNKGLCRLAISHMRQLGIVSEGVAGNGQCSWNRNGQLSRTIAYEIDMQDIEAAWMRVSYVGNDAASSHDTTIHLTYSTPHYGGRRWWFECPSADCGRRVGVLYMRHTLACNHCCRITYASQNCSVFDRHLDHAFKLAAAIGLGGNIIEGFKGDKPKGMHWNTYYRKVAEVERLACQSLIASRHRLKW